ncbi:MAG TPA: DHA2 family efflux MFS transporter permease subunit [Ktedonobacterales bacterium]
MRRLDYKWRVLISVIFGLFMVILDTTVVNVAFPTLRAEYGASIADSQWIISIYVMALGVSTPLSAFLAERFGIKATYVTGLALFVIGSAACGVSPSLGVLIAARALQGVGGGLALPLGTTLLFSAFTAAEQGLAFGVFGIALVVAPALGPILGGALVDHGDWRWIFFINIPIGVLGFTLASLWLREKRADRPPRFDLLGFITSTVGFGSVLYAASVASSDGWTAQHVVIAFAVGGVSLLAFALIELFVAREPMLNLRLFSIPVFTLATVVGWVSVLALFGAEFLLPLYLQTLRGKSAFETGLILLPLAVASGIVAPFSGKLYDLVGPRIISVVGFGLLAVNTWQFAQLRGDTSISLILLLLALRGVALGLTVQTTLVVALSRVPTQEVARASSLSNSTRQVVQSIGVAVLATVLVSTLSAQVKSFETQFQTDTVATATVSNPYVRQIADQFKAHGLCGVRIPAIPSAPTGAPVSAPAGAPTQALVDKACAESLAGYQQAYQWTFAFALLATALGLLLPGWPLKWSGRAAPGGEESAEARQPTPAQGL